MGGRGGASGLSSGSLQNGFNGKWFGISVTDKAGRNTEYFFKQTKASTLMRIGLDRSANGTDIKPQTMVKNAKRQGWDVKIITPKETEELMNKRDEERKKRPDYEMGTGTKWGNRANRRAAKESRLSSRRRR